MLRKDFIEIIGATFSHVKLLEEEKGKEYTDLEGSDRLSHFKELGAMMGENEFIALRGNMSKHTKSIYDMVKHPMDYGFETWIEKIDDHILYLILLKGLLVEAFDVKEAANDTEVR